MDESLSAYVMNHYGIPESFSFKWEHIMPVMVKNSQNQHTI